MSPVIEGSGQVNWAGPITRPRVAAFEYDFAVDGGAVGAITMRGQNQLPSGAVVLNTIVKTVTALTSGGSATVAISIQAANDVISAAAYSGTPYSAAGVKKGLVNGGTDPLLLSAARTPAFTVAAAALTAGKVVLIVTYLTGVTD